MAEIADNLGNAGTQSIAPAYPSNPAQRRASPAPRASALRFDLRLQLLFGAAAVLILMLAIAGLVTSNQYSDYQRLTLHTYQVREQITLIVYNVHAAELEARSYGLTGRDVFAQRFYRSMAEAEHQLDALDALVADNPAQIANTHTLRREVARRRAQLLQILADYRLHGTEAARLDVLAMINQPERPVSDLAERMRAMESGLLAHREAQRDRSAMYVAIVAVIAVGGSLLLMLFALISVRAEQRRRQHSELRLAQGAQELQLALGDARQLADTLRRLSLLGEMLQSCREPDEAIAVIERALPPLLPEMSGCLSLINPSQNTVEARMHWGARGADLADGVFAPDDCWALRRSQAHPGFGEIAAPTCAHLVHAGVTAGHVLCLPLSAQGQVLGVLSLVAEHAFDPGSRELMLTVGDQLALAIANLRLQQSLREQSIRDPLTGLFNRRYLEASLPRELARAERRRSHVALLMLDLDHFKRYNDSHGHDAGDALLGQFGVTLTHLCRGEDIACRYGGEEFTVVLVDIDKDSALARAEAIRSATTRIELRHRGQRLPAPSVSIGVAMSSEGISPEELKRTADQALYRAKREGRDRVMVHNAA
ncbi:MAG TPA: diguanylate cyclase [Rhodanobacteraceae bacterium]|nr:diguanylate cyclase [Rhodanobacteraceae bacterium]